MTAKECIKAKCADCFEGRGLCSFTDCPLYSLKKAQKGSNRAKAIRDYCRWCRKDLPYWVYSSPSCPIYKYLNLASKTPTVAPKQGIGEENE